MMDYDVSLHILVVLVVVISTSPRTSNRTPDAEVIEVFVLGFLQFFSQAVVPPLLPPKHPSVAHER